MSKHHAACVALISLASSVAIRADQIVLPIRAVTAAAVPAPRGVVRVSVASDGTQANGISTNSMITADGRYVVFQSTASNLVANDTNSRRDVFLHDRSTGIMTRESIASSGAEANADCSSPRISSDGRFVTFISSATNLVSGVSGQQIYVRDRQLGLTTVASVSTEGSPSNSGIDSYNISSDARFVTFATTATNLVAVAPPSFTLEVYTRDRSTGTTTRDSVSSSGAAASGDSLAPSITDDGRYVAFYSYATNLVSGVPSDFRYRVFVYERSTGQTTLASVGPSGETLGATQDLTLSADGRFLAFSARASTASGAPTNLYMRDRQAAVTTIVVASSSVTQVKLSADGRFLTYNRSYSGTNYVELYDRSSGQPAPVLAGFTYTATGGTAISFDSAATLVTGDTNGTFDVFVAPVASDSGAPNPPSNLAFTLAGSTLTLTWAAPSGGAPVTDYLLEAGSVSRSTNVANFSTGNIDTRFSTPFTSRDTYYIRIRAVNAAGVSLPSNEITLSGLVLPGAPENLTASVTGSSVTLTWSQATGNLASYILEAGSTPGGTDLTIFNTGNTNTTLAAQGVAAGTYYVRVRAVSLAGAGPASNEVSFTVGVGCPPPAAPTGLTRSVVGSSVTFSWTAAAGATSYVLEAGASSGSSAIASFDSGSAATTYTATGVPAGTYFVRIRSKNGCGQSVPSNEVVAIVAR